MSAAAGRTALVTGANRGLGLEYCRQLAAGGWRVFATVREPSRTGGLERVAVEYPGRITVVGLDVVSETGTDELVRRLEHVAIHLLINNAGTFGPEGAPGGMRYQSLASMDYGIWRQILEVNLLAPFRLTAALAPSLRLSAHPVVVMLSSDLGSIANNRLGQAHAYRTSKAALNMLTKGIANEWRDVIIISMAPGWCKTDLGGEGAQVEPADSVRAQLLTFEGLNAGHSGQFLDRFGAPVAW